MTALPKDFSRSLPSPSRNKSSANQRLASNRRNRSQAPKSAPINLNQQPLPTGLQFLLRFQQATSVVSLGLVGVALAVYGWTVYTPRAWSHEFKKLRTLQSHERQLVSTNEMLKNQLARQAEKPNSGLIRPNPNYNVFLPSSKEMVVPSQKRSASPSSPVIVGTDPLAY
jgi:hypothetical protein